MNNEELRQLALAATPGPWNLGLTSDEIRMVLSGDSYICHVQVHQTPRACGEWQERERIANAAYLAAANPAAVLALLDENARLREALEGMLAGNKYSKELGYWVITRTPNDEALNAARAALDPDGQKERRAKALSDLAEGWFADLLDIDPEKKS